MQNYGYEKGSKYRKWMENIVCSNQYYDFIAALLQASILEGLFGFSYGVLTQEGGNEGQGGSVVTYRRQRRFV